AQRQVIDLRRQQEIHTDGQTHYRRPLFLLALRAEEQQRRAERAEIHDMGNEPDGQSDDNEQVSEHFVLLVGTSIVAAARASRQPIADVRRLTPLYTQNPIEPISP